MEVKAQVVEKDGEISCSIEETNRIRLALGLKPLKVDSDEPSEEERARRRQEQLKRREESAEEMRQKLEESRRRRIEDKQQKKKGEEALSALYGDEESDDLTKWITKSREVVTSRHMALLKQRELDQRERELEEEEPEVSAGGLKVAHRMDSIGLGDEMIMTLRDQSILKDGDVNQDTDELENALLVDEEKRAWKKKQQQLRNRGYDVYEEYENQNQSLLSKYDDSTLDFTRESFELDASGGLDTGKERRLMDIKKKLALNAPAAKKKLQLEGGEVVVGEQDGKRKVQIKYSLDSEAPKMARDFFTAEEMASFKKTRKVKKKRVRRSAKSELADLEDEEENSTSFLKGDHGSRASRPSGQSGSRGGSKKEDDEERRKAYQRALRKEEAKVRERLRGVEAKQDEDIFGEEKETSAFSSKLQTLQAAGKAFKSEKAVLSLIAASNEEEQGKEENGAENEDIFEAASGLVIDDTGEFVRALPHMQSFQQREQERKAKEDDARKRRKAFKTQKELLREMQRQGITVVDEEEDDGALNMQPQRIREHHHSSMSMDVDSDERAGVGDEDLMDVGEGSGARSVRAAAPTDQMSDNEEDEDDEFEKMKKLKNVAVVQEPEIGKGIAGTLAYLRAKGDLQQRKVGRARDPLLSAPGHSNADELDVKARADEFSTPKDREMARHNVILSYKNEFGLEMTPKEAYRFISYRFHGQMPGKKHREKYIHKNKEKLKEIKAVEQHVHSMKSVRNMKKGMETTQQPFLVMSGRDAREDHDVDLDKVHGKKKNTTRRKRVSEGGEQEGAPPKKKNHA